MAGNDSTRDVLIQREDSNVNSSLLKQSVPSEAANQNPSSHQSLTSTAIGANVASKNTAQNEKAIDLSEVPTAKQKRKLDELDGIVPEVFSRPLKYAKIQTQTDAQRALRRQGLKLSRVVEQMTARFERRRSMATQIECLLNEMDKVDVEFDIFANAADGLVDSTQRLKEAVEDESD